MAEPEWATQVELDARQDGRRGPAKAPKIVFGDTELLDDCVKEPTANLGVAMDGDCRRAAVWVTPARMTALLADLLEAQRASHALAVKQAPQT